MRDPATIADTASHGCIWEVETVILRRPRLHHARIQRSVVLAALICLPLKTGAAEQHLVRNVAAYQQALKNLKPGDSVVLADGIWQNADLVFSGNGRIGQPITLRAQTPGKVVLSGQSRLRLAGEHLEVANLVFRDGWAPGGEVVSFRRSPKEWANNSRVTGLVIDSFNKPDRQQADHWVALYGHDNRIDHSQLRGKSNVGTTLVVIRNDVNGLENRHRIDHNWFGPRPNLGANGGETIRVGTSKDSQSDSRTLVENNWFEQCDGEVEIVSNKSGANVYRGNVFVRSRGSLVLRHGHGNLVERNVFLGSGKPHTGGVRVINQRQTIRDNYFEGLAGDGFAAALTVMAGRVDAPLNRYARVEHARIEGNSFIDVHSVFLGAGLDEERNGPPVDSRVARNLFRADGKGTLLRSLGDLSGMRFDRNIETPALSSAWPTGVQARALTLTRAANGLLYAQGTDGIGAPLDLAPVKREEVGVRWYPKDEAEIASKSGAEHPVLPGEDTLAHAVSSATAGTRLQLQAGRYLVHQVLELDRPLSVVGPRRGRAQIAFTGPALFSLKRGASLRLAHLEIDGSQAPDAAGNAVIRVAPGAQAANFTLQLENSALRRLDINEAFDAIQLGKGSMAELIALQNVQVEDVSGSVVNAAAETEDLGTYNAEVIRIRDSRFERIAGPVLDLYRGGGDESTFGPELEVRGSTFDKVGQQTGIALRLHGVQQATLQDNRFRGSGAVRFSHQAGAPRLRASGNQFVETPAIVSDTKIEASP